ncbi:DUF3566 domain-containing protein [Microbacterium ureisolvens]|uniref:DUF3566 domain-containing protein n=1 Tax=Microbacterium ureisolvens TaxID=2781186 RepID=A0ABS7I031_9MICO|nr:DUF3566 domain-containing protein [Microbacterium ureisolvens]MBW9110162.1 DUF3566 domain-containing protein [Microbacterium ureisolvens]
MSSIADRFVKKSTHNTGGKQVRLRLVYVDFWSALKLSFLAAIAISIVSVVGLVLLYLVVRATDTFAEVDAVVAGLSDGSILLSRFLRLPQVLSFAAIVAILNLVVFTVLGAVLANIYNLAVKVTGGFPVGFTSS